MVDLLTKRTSRNPAHRRVATLPSTLGETLGAAFDMPTTGDLFASNAEMEKFDRAAGLRSEAPDFIEQQMGLGPVAPRNLDEYKTEILSPEQLTERYGHLGLEFDRFMSAGAANILAEAKRAEIVRDDILSRGPGGLAIIPQFGAALLAMAADPIELGSTFIPFFGQANKARMLMNAGRGGRAALAATEGALGNALLEPLYMGFSNQMQLDYTMVDALTNVALGAVLGGTAGVLSRGGRQAQVRAKPDISGSARGAADTPRAGRPIAISEELHEKVLKSAVGQVAQGRVPIVDDVFGLAVDSRQTVHQFVFNRGGVNSDEIADPMLRKSRGMSLDEMAELAHEAGFINKADKTELKRVLQDEADTGIERLNRVRDDPKIERKADRQVTPVIESRSERMALDDARRAALERGEPEIAATRPDEPSVDQPFEPEPSVTEKQIKEVAAREKATGRDFASDPEAARRVDDPDRPEFDIEDTADLDAEIDELRQSGALTKAEEDAIVEATALQKKAKSYGKAARAAASCLVR